MGHPIKIYKVYKEEGKHEPQQEKKNQGIETENNRDNKRDRTGH